MPDERKPYSEKKKEYNREYSETHLKRIPLDVQRSFYEKVQFAARSVGVPVNRYIKEAITARLEKDGFERDYPPEESPEE